MALSMTGYGTAHIEQEGWLCQIEIRSVNQRFLDVRTRLPQAMLSLENAVKDKVKKVCHRGKVDCSVRLESSVQENSALPKLHDDNVRHYAKLIAHFEELTGREVQMPLRDILSTRDFFSDTHDQEIPAELGQTLLWQTLEQALIPLQAMKEQEGAALLADIEARLQRCEELLHNIETVAVQLPQQYQLRLQEHLRQLQTHLDAERLHQEVALMAERVDISEEIVRFRTHLQHMRETILKQREIGKRGEFLLQELNREVNTMASKSNDTVVSHTAVDIKAELEKIREQIQNIE